VIGVGYVSDAANSDDAAKRVVGRPFAPGQSGNPTGRPKAARELAELVRKLATRDGEERNALVERLMEIALHGKPGSMVTVRALEVLLERGYGKAPVTVEDAEGNAVSAGLILLPMRVDDAG
jgi:hypothetical protein